MWIDPSQSPALFKLASEKLGGHYCHEWNHRLLTVMSRSGVLAQAVFTGITPGVKCELSMWAEADHGLAGRRFARQICKSAFVDLGCKRMHAVTRESNTHTQVVLQKMGFVAEARLEAWFGHEHGLMFKMMLPNCRWLSQPKDHEGNTL
jgi:hypothetical protein